MELSLKRKSFFNAIKLILLLVILSVSDLSSKDVIKCERIVVRNGNYYFYASPIDTVELKEGDVIYILDKDCGSRNIPALYQVVNKNGKIKKTKNIYHPIGDNETEYSSIKGRKVVIKKIDKKIDIPIIKSITDSRSTTERSGYKIIFEDIDSKEMFSMVISFDSYLDARPPMFYFIKWEEFQNAINEYKGKIRYTNRYGRLMDLDKGENVVIPRFTKIICDSIMIDIDVHNMPFVSSVICHSDSLDNIVVSNFQGEKNDLLYSKFLTQKMFDNQMKRIEDSIQYVKLKQEEIERARKQREYEEILEQRAQARMEDSIKNVIREKYGNTRTAELLLNHEVALGMSEDMCRLAWGIPEESYTTITEFGIGRMLIYGRGTLLFIDNKLKTISY